MLEVIYRFTNRICHAVFFQTPFVSPKTFENVYLFLEKRGINYTILPVNLLEEPDVIVNQPDRCYHCKKAMFEVLVNYFNFPGASPRFMEGTNLSEALQEYRPGLAALEGLGIESPLRKAGMTKEDIQVLRQEHRIPPGIDDIGCLATRIPYGTPITQPILEQIEKAEKFLRQRGFHNVRVRYFGDEARVEVDAKEIDRFAASSLRESFLAHLEELGFSSMYLDLKGYRKGNLDRQIGSLGNR